jgi:hypothetical protein
LPGRDTAHRNNFRFPFFDDEFTHAGQLLDRYRRVRLRNGGSDRYAGFIRDELSQALFRQAGHAITQNHRSAAVFLNGKYYGAAWLKTPRTENHLSRLFGGESERFEIIAGGDRLRDSWWSGNPRATDDFHQVHRMAVEGFTGPAGESRFVEFGRRICVDELIRYYAMQIYINNLDWPNHNIEMWRYFPTEDEKNDPQLHPYLRDGRWRVFSHDLEAAWAIWDNYDHRAQDDTLRDILTGENSARWNSSHSSAFLHAFVSRDDTREKLANTFVDLTEGAFAPANVIHTLDGLIARIENELNHSLRARTTIGIHELWWPTIESMGQSRDAIRRFAEDRPFYILHSAQAHLGVDVNRRFAVTLTVGTGGGAVMNTRPVAEGRQATGNYFAGTSITLTALPHPGYRIDYWTVNGIDVHDTGGGITVKGDADVSLFFVRD